MPVNNAIHRFTFDPDYHVDLILFRRILGTVNNATYFKPGVSYDIVDNFGARVDIMYAIANRPVAYPGNGYNLGLEIDAQLMYKNEEEGFYAGLVYGVLFPFAALGLPGEHLRRAVRQGVARHRADLPGAPHRQVLTHSLATSSRARR